MSVSILMGSPSDWKKMQLARDILHDFDISCEVNVLSAHRAADALAEHVHSAPERGVKIFICGAGMAAHLAGAVAGHTSLPVIGVPISGSAMNGEDALYSTVQMPKGVPVATVAIDGAQNAGILAMQMLAISDKKLADKLVEFRKQMREDVLKANEQLT